MSKHIPSVFRDYFYVAKQIELAMPLHFPLPPHPQYVIIKASWLPGHNDNSHLLNSRKRIMKDFLVYFCDLLVMFGFLILAFGVFWIAKRTQRKVFSYTMLGVGLFLLVAQQGCCAALNNLNRGLGGGGNDMWYTFSSRTLSLVFLFYAVRLFITSRKKDWDAKKNTPQ
jgi:heme O synthase-like polyprenyltransferase